MERDIRNNHYVEHGYFSGHYYGTSIRSIRSIIDSGRTCILVLIPSVSTTHTHTHTHPSVPEIIAPFTELYYSSRELLPRDNRGPLATNLGGPNNSTPIHYFYCGGSKCPLGSIFKGTNEEIEGLCPPGALWCTLVPALTFTSQSKAVPTHKLVHTDVYTKAQCLLEHHMVRQKAIKYAEEQTT